MRVRRSGGFGAIFYRQSHFAAAVSRGSSPCVSCWIACIATRDRAPLVEQLAAQAAHHDDLKTSLVAHVLFRQPL